MARKTATAIRRVQTVRLPTLLKVGGMLLFVLLAFRFCTSS
jgi:hypothetical protein